MKRLSLFCAVLLAAMMSFADVAPYVVEGSIAGALAGGTPVLANGFSGSSFNRGGFVVADDAIYFANNTTGHMKKMNLDLSAVADDADSIGTGHYMDMDAAGNWVIYAWTGGSASMDVAQIYNAQKQLIRCDTIALNGRCDMPFTIGNMVQGRGAHIVACNSATSVLRYNYVDGAFTSVDTIPVGITLGGNSSVSALDVDHFTVQSRGNALIYVDMSGATPVVTNMSYFGASTFTSAYGGQVFQFAGHTLYVMGTYKVGGYMGSFAVYDITDPANPYEIAAEPNKLSGSAMGTACVTFRVKVDGQVAHIYEYAAFQVRKYDLTVTPACYMKQGNEGAQWISMNAGEGVFTYQGIYAADSLYINATAADAGATLYKRADMTYNGTVLVNDTVLFTYNSASKTMTIDSVGHYVPTLTFNVTVPAETPSCFITANFNNWGFTRMRQLSETTYTYTYRAEDALAASVAYKYCAGADLAYVEKTAEGSAVSNRAYAANDVVAAWTAVPVKQVITYELNGGVTNDYGWTSKGAVAMELQNVYNTVASAQKAWVKVEDGKYYYQIGENWMEENAAAGQACTVTGFLQNVTYNEKNYLKNAIQKTDSAKLYWLHNIIVATRSAAGLGISEEDMVENVYRKELSSFLLCSPAETSWPAAPGYEVAGLPDSYTRIWKHAFANPESVNADFTLNTPYKEGFTFDGWYASADFSGEKVTTITPNTASCTLYAKWVEYIMTIAEASAAQNDSVKTAGVVTYIRNSNVYIQDASGATLVYLAKGVTAPQVGDKITVKGLSTTYGGAPEIAGATILATEANQTLPVAVSKSIADLTAEGAALKMFGQRVKVLGVKIASYDTKGNAYVTDGVDTIQCYYMTPDQTIFAVGKKVNLTALVGYYNKFQFVGDVAGFELTTIGKVDPYVYPARGENGEYTLTNKWIISNVEDNFEANKPGPADNVRGMAAKDGKFYFINRAGQSITVVDAATAEMLTPIAITGDHLFQAETVTDSSTMAKEWKASVTLAYNDIKFDNAGHALIGACVSGNQHFQIYKVDLATGAATQVIDERLYANPDFTDNGFRFDAFGVYGDVDGDAIIMAMDANSFNAYKWTIESGKAGAAEQIDCALDPAFDESLLISNGAVTVTNYGTAPQIFPVDNNYFYIDGWSTLPMLFDMNGTLADDFIHCPTGVRVPNNEGDTCTMNQGHNGLVEFQVGDEYFLLMAATNTVGKPASAFALYKFADAAKSFDGLTPLWYFPAEGMGSATNGCRTAVPSVEVNGTKATLYVYTNNNGYGVYEFTGKAGTAVENVASDNVEVKKVIENGQVMIIKNGVRYNVLGAVVK